MVEPRVESVEAIRRDRWLALTAGKLSKVLATGSLDQAVEGVVDVVVVRLDARVLEIDRLPRVVPDVCDVTGGIVDVVQVLQAAGLARRRIVWRRDGEWGRSRVVAVFGESRSAPRIEMDQPEV